MSTEELIELLKSRDRGERTMAMRHAVTTILYKKGVPQREIGRFLNRRESAVNNSITKTFSLLSLNDMLICDAYDEASNFHVIEADVQQIPTDGRLKTICRSITIDGINL